MTDNALDAQRETTRQSLDEIAAEVGAAVRDAGLTCPVFLTRIPGSAGRVLEECDMSRRKKTVRSPADVMVLQAEAFILRSSQ